jgi:hypothetical protein
MRCITCTAPDTRQGCPDRRGWTNLRVVALGPVLLAFAVAGVGCAAAEQRNNAGEADVTALPQEVRDALDRATQVYSHPLDGAKWAKVHLLGGTDHPVYQLRGTNARGNTIEMEVTKAGRVIEVEEHGIPLGEVPAPVVEALKAKRPQLTPTRVEAIYQTDNPRPVSYGFEGTDPTGKSVEVYISADGTFLN